MQKRKLRLWAVGLAALVGVCIVATYPILWVPSGKARPGPEVTPRDDFRDILQSLIVDMPPSLSDAATLEEVRARIRRRDLAVQALRGLGTNALPHLTTELRRLCDADPHHPETVVGMDRVRAALRVLGEDAKAFLPEVLALMQQKTNAIPCLVALTGIGGEEAGLAFLNAVLHQDGDTRVKSLFLFGYSDFPRYDAVAGAARPWLLELLQHTNPVVRIAAVNVVADLADARDESLAVLIEMLQRDEDVMVRVAAMKAMERHGTNAAAALPALLKQLRDPELLLRRVSASVLAKVSVRSEVVLQALSEAAEKDADERVRWNAVRGMTNFGSKAVAAAGVLERIASNDPSARVRRLALRSIEAIRSTSLLDPPGVSDMERRGPGAE
ncbi:HEAT repeat domain-containing protein [Limisphaera sp. VF-2]|uniref:HEAT repeat domain-containing protein n=1 Tax=Limisphaera sp. VF-2 TaxID=3400418 RepID=UPI003C1F2106